MIRVMTIFWSLLERKERMPIAAGERGVYIGEGLSVRKKDGGNSTEDAKEQASLVFCLSALVETVKRRDDVVSIGDGQPSFGMHRVNEGVKGLQYFVLSAHGHNRLDDQSAVGCHARHQQRSSPTREKPSTTYPYRGRT